MCKERNTFTYDLMITVSINYFKCQNPLEQNSQPNCQHDIYFRNAFQISLEYTQQNSSVVEFVFVTHNNNHSSNSLNHLLFSRSLKSPILSHFIGEFCAGSYYKSSYIPLAITIQ